ncbi:MAG: peptidylprolyl isomerase [Pyrinomonadaceae bacterium]
MCKRQITNAWHGTKLRLLLAAIFFAVNLSACDGQRSSDNGGEAGDLGASIKRNLKPEADQEAVVIETDFGRMVIELYPNIAPKMVERFKTLVRSGFYDGTAFHRIDPTLGIIQGGDPLSKDNNPANDGVGKSDEPDVTAEFSDIPYTRGIVGAARSQMPNSANSQFFVTLIRQPAFDEKYTIFGRVIAGIDTAGIISNAQVQAGSSARWIQYISSAPRCSRDQIFLQRRWFQIRKSKVKN